MIEGVANGVFDDPRRFDGLQPSLVLALKLGFANEHRNQRRAGRHHIVGGQRAGALGLADAIGMVFQRA